MDARQNIKEVVKEKYGEAALRVPVREAVSCCGDRGADAAATRSPRISTTPARMAQMPEDAVLASLGCGNPTALAELNPGETVLDLGSGGGIDVLLSARRVGPDRQSLRPRHDRRNAGAGPRKSTQSPASRMSSS